MSEFVYLYRSGARPTRSPEQAQQEMQRWMTWLKDLTDKGHVKDPGHPLERTGKLVAGKAPNCNRWALRRSQRRGRRLYTRSGD